MPLISVIVPVYKVENYLRRCVDSILVQTFTDFEVILVDDGSPDNCGAICDEYAELDPRVRVIHRQNGGLSAARNSGIEWALANSSSQWLSFVDSDDWVHPQFLEILYRAASENNVKVSICELERTETQTEYPAAEYSSNVMQWDQFYYEVKIFGSVAWNKLYKKELFSTERYPVGRLHEDEFVTYKILYAAGTVAYAPLALYYYFQNAEGIMKSSFSLKRLDAIDALTEQCRFAKMIKNKEFYYFCAKRRFTYLTRYPEQIQASDSIDSEEKESAIRRLNKETRKQLIRDGRVIAPINEYRPLYEKMFPKVSWLCWTCIGIGRKLKRMAHRNDDN